MSLVERDLAAVVGERSWGALDRVELRGAVQVYVDGLVGAVVRLARGSYIGKLILEVVLLSLLARSCCWLLGIGGAGFDGFLGGGRGAFRGCSVREPGDQGGDQRQDHGDRREDETPVLDG